MAKGGYRPGGGRPKGIKETKPRARRKKTIAGPSKQIGAELEAEVNGEKAPVTVDGKVETPLEFMLRIMNDATQPEEFRARMATSAAPFCHVRKGEGAGKKEEKNSRAKTAGEGRFRASAPPVLKVISNEK